MIKLTRVIQKPADARRSTPPSGSRVVPLGEARDDMVKNQIEDKLAEAKRIEGRIKEEKSPEEKLKLLREQAAKIREAAEIAKEEGTRSRTEEWLRKYSNLVRDALEIEKQAHIEDKQKASEYAELKEFARARFANAKRYEVLRDHLCAAEEYGAAIADIEEAIERAPKRETEGLIEIRDNYIHEKIGQYSKVNGFEREVNSSKAELRISFEERARIIEDEMRRRLRKPVDAGQRKEIAQKLASAGALVKRAQKIAEGLEDPLNTQKNVHVSKNLLLLAAKEFLIAEGFEEVEVPKELIKMATDAQNTESDLVKSELSKLYVEMAREYREHGSYDESGKLFDCAQKTIETMTEGEEKEKVYDRYIEGYLGIVDYLKGAKFVDGIVRSHVKRQIAKSKIAPDEEENEYARVRTDGLQTVAAGWESSAMKGDALSGFRAIKIRDAIEEILQGATGVELQNRRAQNLTNRARLKGQKGFKDYICAAGVYAQIETVSSNGEAINAKRAQLRSLVSAAKIAPTPKDKVETIIDAMAIAKETDDKITAVTLYQILKTINSKLESVCYAATKDPFRYGISFDGKSNLRVGKSRE